MAPAEWFTDQPQSLTNIGQDKKTQQPRNIMMHTEDNDTQSTTTYTSADPHVLKLLLELDEELPSGIVLPLERATVARRVRAIKLNYYTRADAEGEVNSLELEEQPTPIVKASRPFLSRRRVRRGKFTFAAGAANFHSVSPQAGASPAARLQLRLHWPEEPLGAFLLPEDLAPGKRVTILGHNLRVVRCDDAETEAFYARRGLLPATPEPPVAPDPYTEARAAAQAEEARARLARAALSAETDALHREAYLRAAPMPALRGHPNQTGRRAVPFVPAAAADRGGASRERNGATLRLLLRWDAPTPAARPQPRPRTGRQYAHRGGGDRALEPSEAPRPGETPRAPAAASPKGSQHFYLTYFCDDETLCVHEAKSPSLLGGASSRGALFLSRARLPLPPEPSAAPTVDARHVTAPDLIVGSEVHVHGRRMRVVACDAPSRAVAAQRLALANPPDEEDFGLRAVEPGAEAEAGEGEGQGANEPAGERIRTRFERVDARHRKLLFGAVLTCGSDGAEADRRFAVAFDLVQREASAKELPSRGRPGGMVARNVPVLQSSLELGRTLVINGLALELVEADDATLAHMEAHADVFPFADGARAMRVVARELAAHRKAAEWELALAVATRKQAGDAGGGRLAQDEFVQALERAGVRGVRHELVTAWRATAGSSVGDSYGRERGLDVRLFLSALGELEVPR